MLGGIGSHMPIRRNVWYSVGGDDDMRYTLAVVSRDWRNIAIDAAEDFHGNHDGWESTWPLEFVFYKSEEGAPVARFEVERETVPQFHAWERPVTVGAVDPHAGGTTE